ncbi:MAG: tandem-95 repeat protein [Calditrichaeota bacterium]|nr:tandem-95 repeat protein [Calditrichota bacterium]
MKLKLLLIFIFLFMFNLTYATTYHQLIFDGTLEFTDDETFDTSTEGYNAYITWDENYLYLAYTGSKIGSSDDTLRSDQWIFWYIDSDPQRDPKSGNGTDKAADVNTQITPPDMWPYVWYDTQKWILPFYADHYVMINLPGDTVIAHYNQEDDWWDTYNLDHNLCIADTTIDLVEVKIPLELIGNPTEIYILGYIVSSEWDGPLEGDYFTHTRKVVGTYASWPANSLVGGDGDHNEDGEFTTYYQWLLIDGVSPNAPNEQPVAVDDSATTNEDSPVTVDVLANDSEPEFQTLSVGSIRKPAHGTATTDGFTVTYTPEANYYGTDTLVYTASDGIGGFGVATVFITVDAVNDPPIARDDSASTPVNQQVTVDVLANDTEVENETMTVTGVTDPAHGTATYTASDVTYNPDTDYHGWDNFDYTVEDASGNSSTATVTIAVNDNPNAVNDTTSTNEDTPLTVSPLDNDSDPNNDPLSISDYTNPSYGQLDFDSLNNKFTYHPNNNFHGADSFQYVASDEYQGLDTAMVLITVISVNDPPVAADDSLGIDEDSTVTIDVLANDSDPDGDNLSIVSATSPKHGTVTIEGDSAITYSPDLNYSGADSFNYVIQDPGGLTDTAQVKITIREINDPPEIVNLPDELFIEVGSCAYLEMSQYESDVDTPDSLLTWSFESSDTALTYSYNDTTDTLEICSDGPAGEYYLYVTLTDDSGATDQDTILVHVDNPSGLADAALAPKVYSLSQNYPNPFNPTTTIEYGLPKAGRVVLELYNAVGQKMMTLVNGNQPAGYHKVTFDGTRLASGLYFYRIKSGNFVKIRKMILLK